MQPAGVAAVQPILVLPVVKVLVPVAAAAAAVQSSKVQREEKQELLLLLTR